MLKTHKICILEADIRTVIIHSFKGVDKFLSAQPHGLVALNLRKQYCSINNNDTIEYSCLLRLC